jgi:membrane-associated phospholipid phosphatase
MATNLDLEFNTLDIISMSVIVFYGYPLLRYLESFNTKYAWFFIGLVVCSIFTLVIKLMTSTLGEVFGRPFDARNCDLFCKNGAVGGRPGFPSSHMAITTFFFTMLYFMTPPLARVTFKKYMIIIIGVIYSITMAVSRYEKKCHNITQILGGTIFGLLFALFWSKLVVCRQSL